MAASLEYNGLPRRLARLYWQEKATIYPPPPGFAPPVLVPEVRVMMVPAGTVLDVMPELELPAAAAVLKLSREVLADHVEVVPPVTLNNVHVVATPV